MKNYSLVAILAIFTTLSACSPYHGSVKQYDSGDWYFLASNNEVQRMKVDKLALAKLETQPVMTGVSATFGDRKVTTGYRGIIANLATYSRYNFVLKGPETKSYLLGPGERKIDFLLPGTYVAEVYKGSSLVQNPSVFHVSVQLNTFMNEEYHWYVYTEY